VKYEFSVAALSNIWTSKRSKGKGVKSDVRKKIADPKNLDIENYFAGQS
jgi:hypothetical protein